MTHSISFDDPRWRIEDLMCRGSCTMAGFEHLQALLEDPKNETRPVAELDAELQAFSRTHVTALLTDSARVQLAAYDPANDPVLSCREEHDGLVHQIRAPLPLVIEQHDDRVLLRYEYWNAVRTVALDASGSPPGPPSRLGHSTGRYENGSLVIETTGILPNLVGLPGGAIRHSPKARAVERYSRSADGQRLDIEWSIEDPENFTAPLKGQKSLLVSATGKLEPFVCEAISP
jgi:hypothetical protein